MNPAVLTLLTFLAVVLGVVGVYSLLADLYLRDRSRLNQRMEETFRLEKRAQLRTSALFKNLREGAARAREDAPLTWAGRFRAVIDQSALGTTPRRVLLQMAAAGAAVGALAWLIRGPLLGVLLGLPAATAPFLYVVYRRHVRLNRMLDQLPDAFDLMARVMRAGRSVPQALQAVADEFDQPVAGEFGFCSEQQNLGLSSELALQDLARRTGLAEVKILALALLVQQETGGNLAELLDRVAAMIRERGRLRGKIAALTAEGRMQAGVLMILPLGLLVMLMLLSPVYAEAVYEYPELILAMLASEGVGAFWIYRIVHFDF